MQVQKDLLQWVRGCQGQELVRRVQVQKDLLQWVRGCQGQELVRQVLGQKDLLQWARGRQGQEQVHQVQVQKGWPALGSFLLREPLAAHRQDQEVVQEVAP